MSPPLHEETVPLTRGEKVLTLSGIMLGLLLAALDQTIVATAGPAIQTHLHIEASVYPWLTTAYMVTSTMMVPIYGKLSDLFGRKPILIAGIVIFVGGSALCGFSQSTVQLILARALQGIGSAALFTSAFAVIADIFPPAERGKYQGLLGGVFGISSVVGPLTGGFITDHFGWHWVFFVNVPLGALALGFIGLKMPLLKRTTETKPKVDYLGAILLMVATVPLLLALSLGKGAHDPRPTGYPWLSWQIIGMFVLSLAGIAGFIFTELRVQEPLLDLSLFRKRVFSVSNAGAFVMGAVFFSSIIFLPLFMTKVVELSATSSGLTITPLTLGIVAGNVLSGQAVTKLGKYRGLLLGSIVLSVIGFLIMAFTLTAESTQLSVTMKMVLLGLGLGPSIPLFTLVIQNGVEARKVGVATSSVTFFRSLGGTVGLAVLGTVFGAALSSSMGPKMEQAAQHLPPQLRERFAQAQANGFTGGEGGDSSSEAFPAQKIKERIHVELSKALDRFQNLPGGPPPQVVASLQHAEQSAFAAVDEMHQAFRDAFADAIRAIYRVTAWLAVLAFLITLFLPEIPLRRGAHQGAAAQAAH